MPVSMLERLPKALFCVPLVAHWLMLGVRYGSLTLPSCANPDIESGGMAGESKLGCLRLIRREDSGWVAATALVAPGMDAEMVRRGAKIGFPLVAKPDVGWCGHGVRRVNDVEELRTYARGFPAGHSFLLQAWHQGPVEAGLMYQRMPDAEVGRLVAVTVRHGPSVVGDGRRSVDALIAADPRLKRQPGLRGGADVPGVGEQVRLSTVASLRVGGRYEVVESGLEILARRVDLIARGMGAFHAGRFDVMATSMERLRAGEFVIIEVNGVGSEAIDAWDPRLGLFQALRRVLSNHRAVFAIGAAMRARGWRPIGFAGLSMAWLRQQRLRRGLPDSN